MATSWTGLVLDALLQGRTRSDLHVTGALLLCEHRTGSSILPNALTPASLAPAKIEPVQSAKTKWLQTPFPACKHAALVNMSHY